MINFQEVADKFGEPGTVIDMVSELAIVLEMFTENDGLLYARVVFPRNIIAGKSPDLLIFGQRDAEKYLVSQWQVASYDDLEQEIQDLLKKNTKSADIPFNGELVPYETEDNVSPSELGLQEEM